MNRSFALRLLDSFFQRWWLYLIPLVLVSGLGVVNASRATDRYVSAGVVNVTGESLISDLTSIRGGTPFGYETPAGFTSRQLNTLLQTDGFMSTVAEAAGLGPAVQAGAVTLKGLRNLVWATPDGDTLMKVQASTTVPQLSQNLSQAVIDSYIGYELQRSVRQATQTEEFFAGRIEEAQAAVDQARLDLNSYVASLPPVPTEEARPIDQRIEVERLRSAVESAEATLRDLQGKIETAGLARDQAESELSLRLFVFDEPELPTAPEPRLKKTIMTVAIFVVLGFLLSAGALFLGVVLDRTIRFPFEVEERLGMNLLAEIPESRLPARLRVF